MHPCQVPLVVALALSAVPVLALTTPPDIRADTNRDGVVDMVGNSDLAAKYIWSKQRGAIFLPNIGDSLDRCPAVDAVGSRLTNVELAACNDASGDSVVSPELLAPIRTLPLRDISDNAFGFVASYPEKHTSLVRIFWQSDGQNWTFVDPEFRFNATSLRNGLKLGIDSRHLVTDATVWDGHIQVRFTVTDGNETGVDEVAMKLAPVLFHHHLQAVDTLVTQHSNNSGESQNRFVAQLDAARAKTSIKKPLLKLPGDDIWAQDFMEPGYSSMPGPNGKPISIRVIVRSAQSTRNAGRQVFTRLRGKGIGGYQPTGKGAYGFREINSGGNIETIPPYVSQVTGESYPAGRIITGKHFNVLPAETMLKFYDSQGLQSPLLLESGWLSIGHVDEFVSFLPANNSLGFTISIADPISAIDILRNASSAGFGDTRASSVGPSPDDSGSFGRNGGSNQTIDNVLNDPSTSIDVQQYARRFIQRNLDLLLEETGLNESDVIRVPTLFVGGGAGGDGTFTLTNISDLATNQSDADFLSNFSTPELPQSDMSDQFDRTDSDRLTNSGRMRLAAFYPAAINGVVVGRSYIAAKAFGPIVGGVDIFEAAVSKAYKLAGMDVHFIDDYYSHHSNGGEVHCGTNTFRETAVKWW